MDRYRVLLVAAYVAALGIRGHLASSAHAQAADGKPAGRHMMHRKVVGDSGAPRFDGDLSEAQTREATSPSESATAGRAKSAPAQAAKRHATTPQQDDTRSGRGGGLPERYASIVERNLFRKLGWSGEAKREPFQLVGVMVAGATGKALIGRNGSTVYVGGGDEVGDGYTVTRIQRGAVELSGDEGRNLNLTLDTGVVGVTGGGAHNAARRSPQQLQKKKDSRWRPPKGTPGEKQFEMILEREGLTWEDIKRNPQLAGEVKESYSYVWEDGK